MLPCLVADSAAFLKCAPLERMAERIFTISDVVDEIRDAATRQRLAVLPYSIEFREPSVESIQAVSNFAKKTGDFRSLSAVDIRVMALTLQLEKEFSGIEHIKLEPVNKIEYLKGAGIANFGNVPGLFFDGKKCSKEKDENQENKGEEITAENGENIEEDQQDLDKEPIEDDKELQRKAEENIEEEHAADGEEEMCMEEVNEDEDAEDRNDSDNGNDDDNDDDDEGWITPKNISKLKKKMGFEDDMPSGEEDIKVACLTTDFAMQNVLIQMGLHIVSINGMIIRQARSYILKCYGCNKETAMMDKVFCPNCGNKTLRKVSVTVKNGTIQYHMPRKRRPMNIRGTKYPLPLPKGGRQGNNVILCEDQSQTKQRLPKNRDKVNPLDPDYLARASPFTQKDVTSKAFNKGIHLKQNSRKNPNEGKRTKSRRK